MFLRSVLSCLILLFALTSCNTEEKEPTSAEGPGYFSIRQYIADQWDTYHGQPFGLQKVVYLNGKTDTSFVSAYDMDWGTLFKTFFATDIGDPKYIGQYNFSAFADDATATQNFYYEAKDDKLFTRKLQISADDVSQRVRSIYIETAKSGQWSNFSQKLFYMPLKVISIQEFEWAKTGPTKELRVEYRFL